MNDKNCEICLEKNDDIIYCDFCKNNFCKNCLITFYGEKINYNCLYFNDGCKKIFSINDIIKKDDEFYFNNFTSHFSRMTKFIKRENKIEKIIKIIETKNENFKLILINHQNYIKNLMQNIDNNLLKCNHYNYKNYKFYKSIKQFEETINIYDSIIIEIFKDFYNDKKNYEIVKNIIIKNITINKNKINKLQIILKYFKIQNNYSFNNIDKRIISNFINYNVLSIKKYKTLSDKQIFTIKCPNKNCYLYIDKIDKIMMCDCGFKICNICYNLFDSEHICNKETINFIEQIQNYTNCPKCNITIERIDGCDDMYCTICNIGFNYKTKKIIKKIVNPHSDELKNIKKLISTVNIRNNYLYQNRLILNSSLIYFINKIENGKIQNFNYFENDKYYNAKDCITYLYLTNKYSKKEFIEEMKKLENEYLSINQFYDLLLRPFLKKFLILLNDIIYYNISSESFIFEFEKLISEYNLNNTIPKIDYEILNEMIYYKISF